MKELLVSVGKWMHEWITLPSRIMKYKHILREQEKGRAEFIALASRLGGYAERDCFESASDIARRCAGAEQALVSFSCKEAEKMVVSGLSYAQIERLALLSDCCGEVVQSVSKVMRFGYMSLPPFGGPPNRIAMERAIGKMRAAVDLLTESSDVRYCDIREWQNRKSLSNGRFLLYQGKSTG